MSSPTPTDSVVTGLRDAVRGRVLTPDEGNDYDTARRVYSGTADLQPAVVVQAADAADVQATVRAARDCDAALAVRGGGHSAAGHGTVDGGIVLDVSGLKQLQIDQQALTATAGAGLTAGEYVSATGEHGLTTGFGDTASVGIAGITVGGGLGLLSRKYGMTIDALLGAEIVTAGGELLTIDADHHPDLFWAIRGGTSNFGVITSLTFRLDPVDQVVGGLLVLPATAETLSGFLTEALRAPEELTTIVTIMPCPPVPFVPVEQHGSTVLFTQIVCTGDPEAAERAIAPFRALGTPLADLIRQQRYPQLLPDEDAPRVTAITRTQFLDQVDPSAAATMIDGVNDCPAPMRILQLRVLGGAVAAVDPEATAFGFRDRNIVTYLGGFYSGAENRAATVEWADRLVATLDRGDTAAYVNFVGDPGQATARDCYPPAGWDRLVRIKDRYDPTNLFRRNHNIPPGDGGTLAG